jgi:protein-tyrosine phosphatase
MFDHILILCAGNLCRSPLAESLLRARLAREGKRIEVGSAGLVAALGDPADEMTRVVAAGHGLDLEAHRSRPVDAGLVQWADLILVMEQVHRHHLVGMFPAAAGKVYLLGHWGGIEIPDPYRQELEVYEAVYNQIEAAVELWLVRL